MYDVIIIGAGVCGAAVARELSRYRVNACVLEKEEDVCCGTSKANSGIVHAGYDAEPGTLKARLNVQGNKLMERLSEELDFPFKRNGSLVICRDEEGMPALRRLYDKGIKNGVPDLKILDREEMLEMEPNVAEDAQGFIDCAGIESPGLTSAPAIGKMAAGILREKLHLEEKNDFIAERKMWTRHKTHSRAAARNAE